MQHVFKALELGELNAGAWSADGGWSRDTSGPVIESAGSSRTTLPTRFACSEAVNESSSALIGSVHQEVRQEQR